MNVIDQNCANCYFHIGTEDSGECHKNPPVVSVKASQGRWPEVDADDWCGEWKAK